MEYMEKALAHFQKLLEEQAKRLETLNKPRKDFSAMESVTIGIVDGDGIGPIIMEQAVRVLKQLLKKEIADGKVVLKRIEGLTIENRLAKNQPVPTEVLAEIKKGHQLAVVHERAGNIPLGIRPEGIQIW